MNVPSIGTPSSPIQPQEPVTRESAVSAAPADEVVHDRSTSLGEGLQTANSLVMGGLQIPAIVGMVLGTGAAVVGVATLNPAMIWSGAAVFGGSFCVGRLLDGVAELGAWAIEELTGVGR